MGFFSSLFKKEPENAVMAEILDVPACPGVSEDNQLIAVIAAAVYAVSGEVLPVTTIKRVNSGFPPVWSMSGRQELMLSRQKTKGVKK